MAKGNSKKGVWGHWKLKPESRLLAFEHPVYPLYQIPLDEFCNSAGVLKWIYHMNLKTWVSRKIMKDLIDAIEDIIFPLANVCPQGEDNHINPEESIKNYVKRDKDKVEMLYELMNKKAG